MLEKNPFSNTDVLLQPSVGNQDTRVGVRTQTHLWENRAGAITPDPRGRRKYRRDPRWLRKYGRSVSWVKAPRPYLVFSFTKVKL